MSQYKFQKVIKACHAVTFGKRLSWRTGKSRIKK